MVFFVSSGHEKFEVDILQTDEQKKYIDELEKNGLASSSGMTRLKSATWIDGIVPYELESGLG